MTTELGVRANPTGSDLRPSWRPDLVMDVAIGTDVDAILEAYNIQAHEYEAIIRQPLFVAEVARMKKELERDGVSFRLKARVQAEAMLERSWEMVHNVNTPAAVAADLIKATARWAGYDGKNDGVVGGGAQFSVNIHLSESKATNVTIDADTGNVDE